MQAKRPQKGKGARWRLGRTVDVIFDVADLQGSRRCRDYRYWVLREAAKLQDATSAAGLLGIGCCWRCQVAVMLEYCTRLLDYWVLGTARGYQTLICMLRRVLDSGLLLSCVTTLGYCIKLLGSWMLSTVEKLVCCIQYY